VVADVDYDAQRDKLGLHPVAHQVLVLLLGQLHRQRDLELAGELRIFATLAAFDRVPEGIAVGRPGRGSCGSEDLGMGDALTAAVVAALGAGALVRERIAAAIGSGRHRATAV